MKTGTVMGSLLLAIALLAMAPAWAAVEQDATNVADPDAKCVKCHSRGLKKKLEDGETMSLKIDTGAFESSVHRVIGCTGCHRDVAKAKHPSRQPIASRRSYSLTHNETCSQCHESKYRAYEGSIHANLVASGSDRAPLCSDCHGAHSIARSDLFEPVAGEPCSSCHTDIYKAYEESVHGVARREGNRIRAGHVRAPTCGDCHQAHEIAPVAAQDYLVSTCMNCHEVAKLAHEQWLPNASMHLQSVGCAACHAPEAELRVNLQLYDRLADAPVDSSDAYAAFHEQLDTIEGKRLNALDLWRMVRLTERDGTDTDVELRGRLEVASGIDAHRLGDRSGATRSCESCHDADSEAFRTVTVSITRPDGRRQHFDADAEVLSSAFSIDSISGFYAPGGTRIKILDYLLLAAVFGGLAVPVVHISLGRIVRRRTGKEKNK